MLNQEPIVVDQKGSGQPLLIIFEEKAKSELPFYLLESLLKEPLEDSRSILISLPSVHEVGCQKLSEDLIRFLDKEGIKQATFLGVGDAGAVVQNLAVAHLRRVRRVIFFNSPTRPHLSLLEKIFGKIEKFLPLGLPFRSVGTAFDSRSFLQRVRAPALVVTSPTASTYEIDQASILASSMATAWRATLSTVNEVQHFRDVIGEFFLVPAKRPQKNRAI